jgi:putative membrane protein
MSNTPDDAARRRFPAAVYRRGVEPDARFSLANERTFLAWIRTSLALIAGGVALEALGLDIHPAFRLAASLVLIVTGLVAAVHSWFSWMKSERALRLSQPLPGAFVGATLAVSVSVVGVLVTLGVLLR